MADTYEKDLAQKSSLTTSDFIRVVGSDNVSYKQLVSDVASTILSTRFFQNAYNAGKSTTVTFPTVNAGKAWLINVKHYNSATAIKCSLYVIALAETTWNIEPIHESGTLAKITSVTNNGTSVTFTFDKTAYCSIQGITLN